MVGRRTTESAAFLSTRFGRRMFALFLVCAGVPIVALAGLSWIQVSSQLREQANRRLHAASRATGMRILERLILANEALPGAPALAPDELTQRFAGLAVRARGEAGWRVRFGPPPPSLTAAEEDALAAGDTVLSLVPDRDRRAIVAVRRDADGGDVAGRLSGDLFDVADEDLFPADAELCVFADGGAVLWCSLAGSPVPPQLGAIREAPTLVAWRAGSDDYLGVPWPLFLRGNFRLAPWTVLVAEPEALVYAPMRVFRTILPLVAALGLLLASLLSVQQIRRRLVPLERLATATGRVAGSDFGVRVEVEADDEFAELAAAFNAMALRLDAQFQALERVIEIDRAILSAQDESALAEAFLVPLQRIYPCRRMVLGAPRREASDPRRIYVRDEQSRVASASFDLPANESGAAQALPIHELFPASQLPHSLRAGLPEDVARCVIVPLVHDGPLGGFVLACHRDDEDVPRERLLYLRQVCDQLAAALRGAALRSQNEQLRRFDPLTGLPNQRWLEQRIAERASAGAAARSGLLGLARVAIDGLDRVRATFGQGEVEGIVRRVGDRLRADGGESAVRLDGGEFGLLAESGVLEEVTRRLRSGCDTVRAALAVEERAAYLHARAGAAVWPHDASEAASLLGCADAALRHATPGSAGLVFYAGAMNEALEKRVRLEIDLSRAIERGELRLHYQPIVDARTRQTLGAEALVRWQHATLGLVPPLQFIGLAEEVGLIESIGRWVIREACQALRRWQDAGLLAPRISVNVSPRQVRPELLDEVLRELHEARIPPSLLALELTESSLLGEDPIIAATLESLHRAGIELLVDDFGTGYSSLGYLKRFPVSALKLDRVFVQGATLESDKRAITEAVLAMARELGLYVVAEGVETEEQLRFLADRGCEAVQGYLFAKPLTEAVYRSWLAA